MLYDDLFELNVKRKDNSKEDDNINNHGELLILDEWLGGLGTFKNAFK